jgi:hypothetical protein
MGEVDALKDAKYLTPEKVRRAFTNVLSPKYLTPENLLML